MSITDTEQTAAFEADYSDQSGIFNRDSVNTVVTMIGCGGIGASVLPLLVTMGFKHFCLYDKDVVEPRNIATNLIFRAQDMYRPKVDRVKQYLQEFGAETVTAYQEHFEGQHPLSGLVISGVDSMAARKLIWRYVVDNRNVPLYMDGRIGGVYASLLTVEPCNFDHIDWYETHKLFDDSKAAVLPCTQRTVVYPAVFLGTCMAAHLAAWSRGEQSPNQVDMGYYEEYFFQTVDAPQS